MTAALEPAVSPASLGFAMPPEWAPQEAIWFSWPSNPALWVGKYDVIPAKFAELITAASRFQPVRVNCGKDLQPAARELILKAGARMDRVTFFDHPVNDVWCRDHGPIFVRHPRTGEVAITDWRFNAWGGKFEPWNLDDAVPGRIAQSLGLRRFAYDVILEGGAIEVNGAGSLLTTEVVLLNPNRNPNVSRAEMESLLRRGLGVTEILWLNDGLYNDDTDGHIDNLARFFRADGIIAAVEPDPADPNHANLADNLKRLRSFRTADGRPFEIVELPIPGPIMAGDRRLPASYANYLILNGAILLPTYRQPQRDAQAANILRRCYPGREIVPIDCTDILLEGGAIHCLTQQQPAR